MDPCLVVSPHLDDAVLSAGQFMAGRPDCVVLTLCAGSPCDRPLTTYDANCGFHSGIEAVNRRKEEDYRALSHLAATPVHGQFLDGQYGEPFSITEAAKVIVSTASYRGASVVVGPLGLVHPDHDRTRWAFLEATMSLFDLELWLYEDLPSRVLYPEAVEPALHAVRHAGWTVELGSPGTGPEPVKKAAVRSYRSQAWALDEHCLYVPERFWRLGR